MISCNFFLLLLSLNSAQVHSQAFEYKYYHAQNCEPTLNWFVHQRSMISCNFFLLLLSLKYAKRKLCIHLLLCSCPFVHSQAFEYKYYHAQNCEPTVELVSVNKTNQRSMISCNFFLLSLSLKYAKRKLCIHLLLCSCPFETNYSAQVHSQAFEYKYYHAQNCEPTVELVSVNKTYQRSMISCNFFLLLLSLKYAKRKLCIHLLLCSCPFETNYSAQVHSQAFEYKYYHAQNCEPTVELVSVNKTYQRSMISCNFFLLLLSLKYAKRKLCIHLLLCSCPFETNYSAQVHSQAFEYKYYHAQNCEPTVELVSVNKTYQRSMISCNFFLLLLSLKYAKRKLCIHLLLCSCPFETNYSAQVHSQAFEYKYYHAQNCEPTVELVSVNKTYQRSMISCNFFLLLLSLKYAKRKLCIHLLLCSCPFETNYSAQVHSQAFEYKYYHAQNCEPTVELVSVNKTYQRSMISCNFFLLLLSLKYAKRKLCIHLLLCSCPFETNYSAQVHSQAFEYKYYHAQNCEPTVELVSVNKTYQRSMISCNFFLLLLSLKYAKRKLCIHLLLCSCPFETNYSAQVHSQAFEYKYYHAQNCEPTVELVSVNKTYQRSMISCNFFLLLLSLKYAKRKLCIHLLLCSCPFETNYSAQVHSQAFEYKYYHAQNCEPTVELVSVNKTYQRSMISCNFFLLLLSLKYAKRKLCIHLLLCSCPFETNYSAQVHSQAFEYKYYHAQNCEPTVELVSVNKTYQRSMISCNFFLLLLSLKYAKRKLCIHLLLCSCPFETNYSAKSTARHLNTSITTHKTVNRQLNWFQ